MARITERKRGAGSRSRRPVIYIICEGSETEVNYFRRFRTRHSNIDIRPITSKHKSALHLVERATGTIRQEPYYPEDGDQIWCVFDRNGNTNEELLKAEKIANQRGYSIAFSNPAFELWYLLHFADQKSYLADADAVIAKLGNDGYIPNYSKSTDYYDALLPLRQQAINRALALQEHHTSKRIPLLHRDSNPCTTVSQLVELLQSRASAD
ncbi:MAG: RloB family protein [Oscillospiraceae bacterium]|nr:RloB family protein [Oscillospiraceae bacterium]